MRRRPKNERAQTGFPCWPICFFFLFFSSLFLLRLCLILPQSSFLIGLLIRIFPFSHTWKLLDFFCVKLLVHHRMKKRMNESQSRSWSLIILGVAWKSVPVAVFFCSRSGSAFLLLLHPCFFMVDKGSEREFGFPFFLFNIHDEASPLRNHMFTPNALHNWGNARRLTGSQSIGEKRVFSPNTSAYSFSSASSLNCHVSGPSFFCFIVILLNGGRRRKQKAFWMKTLHQNLSSALLL